MSNLKWQTTPAIDAAPLDQARQQLHSAAQLVAEVGRSLLPPDDEDAMANLGWSGLHDAMVGRTVAEDLAAGLEVATLSLIVLRGEQRLATLSLDGHTMTDARKWLHEQLAQAGVAVANLTKQRPYELPAYPPLQGAPFQLADPRAFDTLRMYYANADLTLRSLCEPEPNASAVRIWPHHFDVASLITVTQAQNGQYIGLGMSPGDGTGGYEQPYFYVNLWPKPDPAQLNLPQFELGGHWHTEGWVGAVLLHETLTSTLSYDQQERMVQQFMAQAVQINRLTLSSQAG